MKQLALVGLLWFCALAGVCAQAGKPALPKTPAGFDEGRAALLRDAADNLFEPGKLIERRFEGADLAEIAAFCHARLLRDEKRGLDEKLGLKGALVRSADATAFEAVLKEAKLTPAAVAKALGAIAGGADARQSELVAWLYARGLNFRLIQRAMDGGRMDGTRTRIALRRLAAAGKGNDLLFEKGHWEFNLDDGGDHPGGHYDGTQLLESLLALGWKEEHFRRALARFFPEGMGKERAMLIAWGDATLCWQAMGQHVAEAELVKAAKAALKADAAAPVAALASARTRVCERWFRTGGESVVGVWTGPLPNAKGEPRPPKLPEELTGAQEFAAALTDELRAHFGNHRSDTLTVVAYGDGSARMIVDRPGRAALPYGPDSPPGADSTRQLYEGRFSVPGRIAYAALVFADSKTVALADVDLVNVTQLTGGALLSAQLDDGVALTPLLLRRASRLIEAP